MGRSGMAYHAVAGAYAGVVMISAFLSLAILQQQMLVVNAASTECTTLKPDFYSESCPQLETIVRTVVRKAVQKEARMAASLMRLEFHDCFVQGCDGSVLLDNTANFTGEKDAIGNLNSLRGFDVIDEIKEWLERECPQTVSCADILALVARDSVVEVGGPSWTVEYGRRDGVTANITLANEELPSALNSGPQLQSNFESKGFNLQQMVALSGAHTIGYARCLPIAPSLYGKVTDDKSINRGYLLFLEKTCPNGAAPALVPLDNDTPTKFDKDYYTNLLLGNGALHSDRVMVDSSGGTVKDYVVSYAEDTESFFLDFAQAMVQMGRIQTLTGSQGQIRTNCHFVNPPPCSSSSSSSSTKSTLKTTSNLGLHKLQHQNP
jgi:peroxidase